MCFLTAKNAYRLENHRIMINKATFNSQLYSKSLPISIRNEERVRASEKKDTFSHYFEYINSIHSNKTADNTFLPVKDKLLSRSAKHYQYSTGHVLIINDAEMLAMSRSQVKMWICSR